MHNYDLILYDLDGTVWDSVPLIMDCFKHAYVEVMGSCDRTDEDLLSYIGKPLTETFAMHEDGIAQDLLESYLEYNHKLLDQDCIDMFPGVMNDLHYIKLKGYKQGVVTSKRIYSAGVTLKLKGLDEFFDVYVFKEHTEHHKPEAEPLIYAANKLGITDMSKVLYVGDAMPDALCAKNAGAGFALVSWSKMDKEAIMKAAPEGSFEVNSIREIID